MDHNKYMKLAIEEAKKAAARGEVPVGAVAVLDDQVVATGYNQKELKQDPTAHAEILAITGASKVLNTWRLSGVTLYVTLEPCTMCAGAIVQSRLDRVVFGASDIKGGACGTCFNLVDSSLLNHRVEVVAGIEEDQCSQLLKDFFRGLRN
ncbi:tRNA(adenine34) deaminase [Desulfitispora alkaliphila]|uniref:tRNA adenosine(34) deaminase TadA n=1 Tax=Desulfitispora alkaliphila TaxID=622674 RepID=UPI003D1D1A4F